MFTYVTVYTQHVNFEIKLLCLVFNVFVKGRRIIAVIYISMITHMVLRSSQLKNTGPGFPKDG